MKAKKLLSIIAIALIALISGCSKDDFQETIGVCPVVLSTIPADKAPGVPLNQNISATFNEAMNNATITETSFTVTGTAPVSGDITFSGNTAIFSPRSLLAPNTLYTGRITTSVKDVDGNALQQDYVWTFTTGVLPFVVSTDPDRDEPGVPLNQVISATFSVPMNPLTLNDATYIVKEGVSTTGIGGSISYSGSTVFFTPSPALLPNKQYTVTITTGAKNLAGDAMASDYVWKFTTLNVSGTPPPVVTTGGLGFGVFGGNAGITNQGKTTVVNGTIGTTAASTLVTGFIDLTDGLSYTVTPLNRGKVTDGIYAAAPPPGNATKAATALAGLNEARALYLSLKAMPAGATIAQLGLKTLTPGTYTSASTVIITGGDLVLDAQFDPNAKWYFQVGSGLTVGDTAPRSVVFKDGIGNPNNVFWVVSEAAVINYAGGGVMVGNIIAENGVTLSSPANSTTLVGAETVLNGRAISLVDSVTMVNTIINVPN